MSKGLPRSLQRGSQQLQDLVKLSIPIKNLTVEIDGATGVGYGSSVIRDLPEGNILILGAIANLQFTKAAAATGITATFDGDYSVGSAPTADAVLSGAEADILPSTAIGVATAGASPISRSSNATQVMLDNTDGSLEINLNVLIDDTAISADNQNVLVNGVLHLAYIVLGDD